MTDELKETPEIIDEKYIHYQGACPHCGRGAENWCVAIGRAIAVSGDFGVILREVQCVGCNTTWTETYNIVGIQNIRRPHGAETKSG